jgi:hypothetical protein
VDRSADGLFQLRVERSEGGVCSIAENAEFRM